MKHLAGDTVIRLERTDPGWAESISVTAHRVVSAALIGLRRRDGETPCTRPARARWAPARCRSDICGLFMPLMSFGSGGD